MSRIITGIPNPLITVSLNSFIIDPTISIAQSELCVCHDGVSMGVMTHLARFQSLMYGFG
jgi:hypothetical protein